MDLKNSSDALPPHHDIEPTAWAGQGMANSPPPSKPQDTPSLGGQGQHFPGHPPIPKACLMQKQAGKRNRKTYSEQ